MLLRINLFLTLCFWGVLEVEVCFPFLVFASLEPRESVRAGQSEVRLSFGIGAWVGHGLDTHPHPRLAGVCVGDQVGPFRPASRQRLLVDADKDLGRAVSAGIRVNHCAREEVLMVRRLVRVWPGDLRCPRLTDAQRLGAAASGKLGDPACQVVPGVDCFRTDILISKNKYVIGIFKTRGSRR